MARHSGSADADFRKSGARKELCKRVRKKGQAAYLRKTESQQGIVPGNQPMDGQKTFRVVLVKSMASRGALYG